MVAIFDLVHKGNCIIGIAYDAFTIGIKHKRLAAERIFARALSVCSEIPGRAYVCPLDIASLPQKFKQFRTCRRRRLECLRKVRAVGDG